MSANQDLRESYWGAYPSAPDDVIQGISIEYATWRE